MPKLLRLPTGALDDVVALLSLTEEQLRALDQLFTTKESAAPFRQSFIDRATERLGIDETRTVAVLAVTTYVLGKVSTSGVAAQAVDDLRDFLRENADSQQKDALITKLEADRALLESVVAPKQERLRGAKILRLSEGPERTAESFRTICQLRPLFEGAKDAEEIVGLVPTVLMEIGVAGPDERKETVAFSLSERQVDSLKEVIERTKKKIDAIRGIYGDQLLTLD